VPRVAELAKAKLNGVIVGDIEALEGLPFSPEAFDYIIAGDVLEHLKDPWKVLEGLRMFLKGEGFIIASIPNVRNWRVIKDLVFKGEWRYVEAGILDDTHLRFFTKKTIMDMFTNCGYHMVSILPRLRKRSRGLNRLSLGLFEEFLAGQYMCKARKSRE
jgi:2-polyprenyl-3-methyl-5-hydroxy-6-metoxy-1,4-benzoquinol methylase